MSTRKPKRLPATTQRFIRSCLAVTAAIDGLRKPERIKLIWFMYFYAKGLAPLDGEQLP